MQHESTANADRTILVCVDNYEAETLRGRLWNPYCQEARPFENLMQFLLQMDELLDEGKYPQPFAQIRKFSQQKETIVPESQSEMTHQEGKLATFAVKIRFRQNASWQGSVTWLEERREQSFRSALELSFLLHSALTAREEGDQTAQGE